MTRAMVAVTISEITMENMANPPFFFFLLVSRIYHFSTISNLILFERFIKKNLQNCEQLNLAGILMTPHA